MEPLDLTTRPPRSPHDELDGLVLLPRTIDKFRASLPGGSPGAYRITGMSARLLEWLGVDENAMRDAVAAAGSDDDVAAWLRARVDAAAYPEYNRRLRERTVEDIADKDRFYAIYPWARQGPITSLFDIVDEDDRRTFAP